jgi:hypothetical protein
MPRAQYGLVPRGSLNGRAQEPTTREGGNDVR